MGNANGGVAVPLPEKALVRIAAYLSVKDIIRVSQTSHIMNAYVLLFVVLPVSSGCVASICVFGNCAVCCAYIE
jgi:hypothetical protein